MIGPNNGDTRALELIERDLLSPPADHTDAGWFETVRKPPPFIPDYDLISFIGMPALDTLKPYLSERGKELLHALPYGELAKIERWWKRVSRKVVCPCCGEIGAHSDRT